MALPSSLIHFRWRAVAQRLMVPLPIIKGEVEGEAILDIADRLVVSQRHLLLLDTAPLSGAVVGREGEVFLMSLRMNGLKFIEYYL